MSRIPNSKTRDQNQVADHGYDVRVRHLNQSELADRWNLSPRTLERWRWLGEGPRFLKLGGRVLYRLEDVEAFESTNTVGKSGQGGPDSANYSREALR